MSVRLRLSLVLILLIGILGGVVFTSVTAMQSMVQDSEELSATRFMRVSGVQVEYLASLVVETDVRTNEIHLALESTVNSLNQLSSSLRQLYAASDFVSREDFNRFLGNLRTDYPAVLSANYIPRVTAERRSAFEESVVREGYANFTIKERNTAGDFVGAGERDVYYPVSYIVPFEANTAAFGFDQGSSPARLAALELARDTGQVVASEPLQLVTGSNQISVALYTPIYRKFVDISSVEARRLGLEGFVLVVIDMDELVSTSLSNLTRVATVVSVDDITSGTPARLYTGASAGTSATTQVGLDVFGRQWQIVLTSLVDRADSLKQLGEITVTLRDRVALMLEGDPTQGFYGLRRHSNPQIIPTYNTLVQVVNGMVADVNTFIQADTDTERADLLPVLNVRADAVFDSASTMIDLLIAEQQIRAASVTQLTLAVAAVAGLVAVAGAVIIYQIVRRLGIVNQAARKLAEGNLSVRTAVEGGDEIGQVGTALNTMAADLETSINTLEERIAVRTRDLQTVADVNTQISTILDPVRLLQDVADLTKERFNLYHSHIYLTNEDGNALVLAAGAGHVGRQMVSGGRSIDINNPLSIVANAARSRQGVIINDVTQSETFLPNPLLPDTQSELAVPLVARGRLLGVLDVQSNKRGYFTSEILSVIELLAGQIATALSNAQLYNTAERTSRHERALGAIDRRIQNAVDVDDILQSAVRELGKALRVPYTAIELQLSNGHDREE